MSWDAWTAYSTKRKIGIVGTEGQRVLRGHESRTRRIKCRTGEAGRQQPSQLTRANPAVISMQMVGRERGVKG
jgi:hypothetical protein